MSYLSSRYDWNLYHDYLRKVFKRIRQLSEESVEIITRRLLDDDLNLITHEHHLTKSKTRQTTKKELIKTT